jgi:glycosyltransferase involved in cell wall biosynthesis
MLPTHIHLLLVGGGEDEAMLKALTAELHLEERVHFTGQVDRTEVTKYRKASDIFVCPSRSEGLGNALLSAMASRLPLVATQEGGIAEYLFDAKRNPDVPTTGWAVDKDSPEQIAEAVKEILADPVRTRGVTDTARKMVEEKYDWDAIAVQMRTSIFAPVVG